MGAIDNPLHPLSIAIGCEATFVARSIDVNIKHLAMMLEAGRRAPAARRSSRSTRTATSSTTAPSTTPPTSDTKADTTLELEHGKPLIFGKNRDKGIRLNGMHAGGRRAGQGHHAKTTCCSTTRRPPSRRLAYLLSRMRHPEFPEPIGVFRAVDAPQYDGMINEQIEEALEKRGHGDLDALFDSGETWTVSRSP